MSEDVAVKIPKAMADRIQKQPWFKYYDSLEEFVVSATRREMERFDLVKKKKQRR